MQWRRLIIIFVYTALVSCSIWLFNERPSIGIDDANIYMVYMRNFSHGHGFVYNIGGERVEGFTSLAWTLIGSFLFVLTDHIEFALFILNLVLLSLVIYQIVAYIDQDSKYIFSIKSLYFLCLLGITPGFFEWTVFSLMETGLWTLLITLFALNVIKVTEYPTLRENIILSLIVSLTALTRPESLLVIPFMLLLRLSIHILRFNKFKLSLRQAVWPFFVFSLTVGCLFYVRLSYFGYPFPNTFYAKVSTDRLDNIIAGIFYLKASFVNKPIYLFILIFSTVYIIKLKKEFLVSNSNLIAIFLIVLLFMVIPLISGGDHFCHQRMLVPIVPILYLIFIIILGNEFFKDYIKLGLTTSTIFFSFIYNARDNYLFDRNPMKSEWSMVARHRDQSIRLTKYFENTFLPTQGVCAAGATAYSYTGQTIDLLGLNNTRMAHAIKVKDVNAPKNHASFDIATFFDLSPDLFWYKKSAFVPCEDIEEKPFIFPENDWEGQVFKNIHENNLFKEKYRLVYIHKKNESDCLRIFAKSEFLTLLDSSIYTVTTIKYDQ